MNLRAVIFDFGNVLCFPPTEEQLAEAATLCGLSTPEFVANFWRKRRDYDRGIKPAEYWRDFAVTIGRDFDAAMVQEMIRREIAFWSRHDARVLAWIQDLRRAGIRTSILSNLPAPLGENLRTTDGFLEHFDQITFSYELSVIKPEPEIYHYAVRGLGVAPEEALFLDDRLENVEGARAIGLRAELFTTWEAFLKELHPRYPLPTPRASALAEK
jgi:putative hydrolase of the HAD superfamily